MGRVQEKNEDSQVDWESNDYALIAIIGGNTLLRLMSNSNKSSFYKVR